MQQVCIVGASGKLGQYMVEHCLARDLTVHAVCRPSSVPKLARFEDRIRVFPGRTNDRGVIQEAVSGCQGVLTVLAPWGVDNYSSGTAQAVLDFAEPDARLIFSCGWHITQDGEDEYSCLFKSVVACVTCLAKCLRLVDLDDQVRAAELIFESDTRYTVVRGSDLEEGESEGLPVWSEHVQDPILASNLTRRVDFALFMVAALENDELVGKAPAICGCNSESARKHS